MDEATSRSWTGPASSRSPASATGRPGARSDAISIGCPHRSGPGSRTRAESPERGPTSGAISIRDRRSCRRRLRYSGLCLPADRPAPGTRFILVLVNAIPNATDNPIALVGPRSDPADGCQPTEESSMRLDYRTVLPEASRAMSGLEKVFESSTLEPKLLELVKQRASQINGCAYCLDMHTKDARAIGEDEQRLHLVAVWREAPFFAPRERAALAWTEALTLLPDTGAPDDVYLAMAREFDPAEQVALTLAIVAINGWNRLAVGFRRPVGSYVSSRHPEPVTMP